MRMTSLAAVASTILLGASLAHAGDYSKSNQEKFKAADSDGDGSLTLTELQTGMPTLAAQFSSIDTNADGKVSVSEMNAFHGKSGDKSMESDQSKSSATEKPSG